MDIFRHTKVERRAEMELHDTYHAMVKKYGAVELCAENLGLSDWLYHDKASHNQYYG